MAKNQKPTLPNLDEPDSMVQSFTAEDESAVVTTSVR
jgi:hypothetical protein